MQVRLWTRSRLLLLQRGENQYDSQASGWLIEKQWMIDCMWEQVLKTEKRILNTGTTPIMSARSGMCWCWLSLRSKNRFSLFFLVENCIITSQNESWAALKEQRFISNCTLLLLWQDTDLDKPRKKVCLICYSQELSGLHDYPKKEVWVKRDSAYSCTLKFGLSSWGTERRFVRKENVWFLYFGTRLHHKR